MNMENIENKITPLVDEGFINNLAKEYNFNNRERLKKRLSMAAFDLRTYDSGKKLCQSETKDVLKKLFKHSSALCELIEELSASEMSLIYEHGDQSVNFEWKDMQVGLIELGDSAKLAHDYITENKLPRKDSEDHIRDFVARLHAIYTDGTGNNDKVTYDEYTGKCSNNFFQFSKSCLKQLKINKTDNALKQLIQDSVKAI